MMALQAHLILLTPADTLMLSSMSCMHICFALWVQFPCIHKMYPLRIHMWIFALSAAPYQVFLERFLIDDTQSYGDADFKTIAVPLSRYSLDTANWSFGFVRHFSSERSWRLASFCTSLASFSSVFPWITITRECPYTTVSMWAAGERENVGCASMQEVRALLSVCRVMKHWILDCLGQLLTQNQTEMIKPHCLCLDVADSECSCWLRITREWPYLTVSAWILGDSLFFLASSMDDFRCLLRFSASSEFISLRLSVHAFLFSSFFVDLLCIMCCFHTFYLKDKGNKKQNPDFSHMLLFGVSLVMLVFASLTLFVFGVGSGQDFFLFVSHCCDVRLPVHTDSSFVCTFPLIFGHACLAVSMNFKNQRNITRLLNENHGINLATDSSKRKSKKPDIESDESEQQSRRADAMDLMEEHHDGH